MSSRVCLGALLLVITVIAGVSHAQPNTDARVQQLEASVRALERRVATLEDQLRQRSAPTPVAGDKANWRKLQMGMSEDEVEKLLGSPTRVDAFGVFTIWHYGNRGSGQVRFDGTYRKVDSWHEP